MTISTIQLSREETLFSRKLLARDSRDPELGEVPLVVSVPVPGRHGYEIDVKCVNTVAPYVDPVLFRDGHEVASLDVADSLDGEYTFAVDGEEHRVVILAAQGVL